MAEVRPKVTPVTVNFADNGTTKSIDSHNTIIIAYTGTKNGENTIDTILDNLLNILSINIKFLFLIVLPEYPLSHDTY